MCSCNLAGYTDASVNNTFHHETLLWRQLVNMDATTSNDESKGVLSPAGSSTSHVSAGDLPVVIPRRSSAPYIVAKQVLEEIRRKYPCHFTIQKGGFYPDKQSLPPMYAGEVYAKTLFDMFSENRLVVPLGIPLSPLGGYMPMGHYPGSFPSVASMPVHVHGHAHTRAHGPVLPLDAQTGGCPTKGSDAATSEFAHQNAPPGAASSVDANMGHHRALDAKSHNAQGRGCQTHHARAKDIQRSRQVAIESGAYPDREVFIAKYSRVRVGVVTNVVVHPEDIMFYVYADNTDEVEVVQFGDGDGDDGTTESKSNGLGAGTNSSDTTQKVLTTHCGRPIRPWYRTYVCTVALIDQDKFKAYLEDIELGSSDPSEAWTLDVKRAGPLYTSSIAAERFKGPWLETIVALRSNVFHSIRLPGWEMHPPDHALYVPVQHHTLVAGYIEPTTTPKGKKRYRFKTACPCSIQFVRFVGMCQRDTSLAVPENATALSRILCSEEEQDLLWVLAQAFIIPRKVDFRVVHMAFNPRYKHPLGRCVPEGGTKPFPHMGMRIPRGRSVRRLFEQTAVDIRRELLLRRLTQVCDESS